MFGDDEILQDFLVEAGEILEQLSEQLVDLENRPDDRDLLNAIFRGFHTVKGGAGFLQLNAMVDTCHHTENLFDKLRNGERQVSTELMDVVLHALDAVNEQFAQVQNREDLSPADPNLIHALEALIKGEQVQGFGGQTEEPAAPEEELAPEPVNETSKSSHVGGGEDVSDAEFEQMLDAIGGEESVAPSVPAEPESGGDEITDSEFENLLDQLHGKGKGPTQVASSPDNQATAPAADDDLFDIGGSASTTAGTNDEINEDEFEALPRSITRSRQRACRTSGRGFRCQCCQTCCDALGCAWPSWRWRIN